MRLCCPRCRHEECFSVLATNVWAEVRSGESRLRLIEVDSDGWEPAGGLTAKTICHGCTHVGLLAEFSVEPAIDRAG